MILEFGFRGREFRRVVRDETMTSRGGRRWTSQTSSRETPPRLEVTSYLLITPSPEPEVRSQPRRSSGIPRTSNLAWNLRPPETPRSPKHLVYPLCSEDLTTKFSIMTKVAAKKKNTKERVVASNPRYVFNHRVFVH